MIVSIRSFLKVVGCKLVFLKIDGCNCNHCPIINRPLYRLILKTKKSFFFQTGKIFVVLNLFSDPMMMGLGAIITMAGAYMAIVMQEQAAANAFALAAASGKKKK